METIRDAFIVVSRLIFKGTELGLETAIEKLINS